jgi:hypothetical protein
MPYPLRTLIRQFAAPRSCAHPQQHLLAHHRRRGIKLFGMVVALCGLPKPPEHAAVSRAGTRLTGAETEKSFARGRRKEAIESVRNRLRGKSLRRLAASQSVAAWKTERAPQQASLESPSQGIPGSPVLFMCCKIEQLRLFATLRVRGPEGERQPPRTLRFAKGMRGGIGARRHGGGVEKRNNRRSVSARVRRLIGRSRFFALLRMTTRRVDMWLGRMGGMI